jgi:phosphoglycolate phosphatase-like HAD superfamily hydrolase
VTHVLFWDIDGTLLTTSRAGIFAWEQAAADVTGQPADFDALPTAGLTDREIAVEALRACGVAPGPEPVARLLRAYERWLPERLSWRAGHVMPGVREILDAYGSRPDVHHLLLTGNLRACALAKLRHYGLDAYFDHGAFAEDALDRPGVARRALAPAQERLGASLPADHLYVIGDTPHRRPLWPRDRSARHRRGDRHLLGRGVARARALVRAGAAARSSGVCQALAARWSRRAPLGPGARRARPVHQVALRALKCAGRAAKT